MRVLVLVEDYPNNEGGRALMYVHTRNVYYEKNGIETTVLNFSAEKAYTIDNIEVITKYDYKESKEKYNCLILHAANIRHHYQFLKKYGDRFGRFVFFYHGHEVLRINSAYSKPYDFVHVNKIKSFMQDVYDTYKIKVWRKYIPRVVEKSTFVFVSKWMLEEFEKSTKITREELKNKWIISYNCVAKCFEENAFDDKKEKEYDFITIRGNLDNSKYSIDIVNRLAKGTPNARFLLVGKGDFFNHNIKADNIEWLNRTMNHTEIMKALDNCKYALMPTRTDAQGLMMCEMAAYGIPVITSDIPVCHEVFSDFENAFFIDNETTSNLDYYLNRPSLQIKHTNYYEKNTVENEVDIILGKGK